MPRIKETVTVIGLGYVGLPLACLIAQKGYKTYGLDLKEESVKKIRQKKSPFKDEFISRILPKIKLEATIDPTVLKKSDIVIICVPTPVNERHLPVFKPLTSAIEAVLANFKKGVTVIVESTINPGVCEEVVLPLFEAKKLKVGKDFFLAHCPERVNPGDPKWNVSNINRCVGGVTDKCLKKSLGFYRSILDATVTPMKSIKEAEATKTIENAFRDVNIAFVNELAKSFDRMGIDLKDVIQGASTKPFAFMAHYPGCGVGGHCIPVDPYYLIEKARRVGFEHDFLKLARRINTGMPRYTVKVLIKELNEIKKAINGTRVGVLGVSYKANVDDNRDAPFYEIKKELLASKAKIEIFDPFIPKESTVKSLEELLKKSEVLLLVTNHSEFKKITPELAKKYGIKLIVDGRNFFSKEDFLNAGIRYKGIGR